MASAFLCPLPVHSLEELPSPSCPSPSRPAMLCDPPVFGVGVSVGLTCEAPLGETCSVDCMPGFASAGSTTGVCTLTAVSARRLVGGGENEAQCCRVRGCEVGRLTAGNAKTLGPTGGGEANGQQHSTGLSESTIPHIPVARSLMPSPVLTMQGRSLGGDLRWFR